MASGILGSPGPARIALVEDNDELRELLKRTLVEAGYEVADYPSGLALLERLDAESDRFELIVSDVRMPGVTGLCLLEGRGAWCTDPEPRMLLITAFGGPELHERARRFGAVDVLDKPFEMDVMLAAIAEALR